MKYEQLYIYLIEGVVEDEKVDLGPSFIGNWVEDSWSFLFFSKPERELVRREVEKGKNLKILDEFFFTYDQWQGNRFKAFKVGSLQILPPWEDEASVTSENKILIDPGVVFGSGLHPTTRDCLILLQELFARKSFKNVLDLGTGTGILAIASAHLGAGHVVAVDLNPLCVKTTKENVKLNGLGQRVTVIRGAAENFVEEQVDLVVANIHYQVMESLFKNRSFCTRPWYILSGLMRSEYGQIKQTLIDKGIRPVRELDHEMTWFTLLGKNQK